MQMSQTNPFVYIVGCPRSGTTLLRRILDAHPELAVSNSSKWVTYPFHEPGWELTDARVTKDFVERVIEFRRFRKFKLDEAAQQRVREEGPGLDYAAFVRLIYDLFAAGKGKRLAGDKTPIYVRRVEPLHRTFPDLKFIHIIRDPRDVCLSLMDPANFHKQEQLRRFSTWTEDPLVTCALRWECDVRLGREAGLPLGPRLYHEVRYEALATEPETVCREMCRFLELDYHDAMVRFHEGKTKGHTRSKKAWLPVTQGLRDWRAQMTPDEATRVESVVGEVLDELRYPRLTSDRAAASDGVAALRRRFANATRSQGDPIPRAWQSYERGAEQTAVSGALT